MTKIPAARLERIARDAGRALMVQEDEIWSRHSSDKVDCAAGLGAVIRTLSHALPLATPMAALSVGSGEEPQFRMLAALFRGGVHLLDVEQASLDVVAERIARQRVPHVGLIRGDYANLLADDASTRHFRAHGLAGRRMQLVMFHHSLYYVPVDAWGGILARVWKHLMAPSRAGRVGSALHAVMMASRSDDPHTTTWLYQHFAGRFFGVRNDQDLAAFARSLRRDPLGEDQQVVAKASRVEFRVDDFTHFMSVVWMILLYPNVHRYTLEQRVEITRYVYEKIWHRGLPLVQVQDHLALYRGRTPRGLV